MGKRIKGSMTLCIIIIEIPSLLGVNFFDGRVRYLIFTKNMVHFWLLATEVRIIGKITDLFAAGERRRSRGN